MRQSSRVIIRKTDPELSYEICNHFHNILGLFDVLPNFPFTTSEMMHITDKQGRYELPHKLPKDLRFRILGNIRKVSKFHEMVA